MAKEAKARIKINKLLEENGWRFFDDKSGKANVCLELHVKLTANKFNEVGEDFEKSKSGFVDYILLDKESFPVVVLEAKSESKNPLYGKEQARKYAQSLNVRFVILTNGNIHYFWDLESGNPEIIANFPGPESIKYREKFRPNPINLINEIILSDYIAITQKSDYASDPRWNDINQQEGYKKEYGLSFLRDYQIQAIETLKNAVQQGKTRFLFEMATGTGKTLVSAAVIKMFLRSGNAKRVLFLVDRLELEDQAWKNFVRYLKSDYKSVIYKENKEDWKSAEIVVSTVQSFLFNNKYRDIFSPTDFDLVISDEAHRSIGGNSRAVFEYFLGYKLGLTATPKDYLKNIDDKTLSEEDPRNWERRQLIDTYKTFGCESGEPTFRYSLIDGVKDGYLINPIVVDARTDITTELLSKDGYAVMINDEEGNAQERIFEKRDFEKKFFSEETNLSFCKAFMKEALRDPITSEIGKTIVFCVSQKHASKITQVLNKLADENYNNKYNSDFAVQVTSGIPDSQQMTINFSDKNNNLNGSSTFLESYKTSKTRVCLTVGMMTTGYDCQDILNIVLLRPIFSPTDFVQIKGRGTRKYDFSYKQNDSFGKIKEVLKTKERFKLFDFFANCQYFESEFNYDETLELPKIKYSEQSEDIYVNSGPSKIMSAYENFDTDPMKTIDNKVIGIEGMKIDWKFYERFENTVKFDDYIKAKMEEGKHSEAEDYVVKNIFNKPEDYFTLEKLREAVKVDRRLSLREILDKIFGNVKKFKTKDELLEEEVQKFISINKPPQQFVHSINQFLKVYILDDKIRDIMKTGEFGDLATNPGFSLKDLKDLDGWRDPVINYVKDYVTINAFM